MQSFTVSDISSLVRLGEKMKIRLLLLPLILFGQVALGGVVTGGGGGLINPRPADSLAVQHAISQWGEFILNSWFQRVRVEYDLMDPNSQANSPFYKVFSPNFDLSSTLQNTGVEVRLREACVDAAGQPFDGSMYARHKNAVCISAFATAPKLTVYNVELEILALLAHEFSHLAGTTEPEAVAIQMRALDDFSRVRFDDIYRQMVTAVVDFGYTADQNKSAIDSILNPVSAKYFDIEPAINQVLAGLTSLISADGRFAFVDESGLRLANLTRARLIVVNSVAGSLDGSAPPETRAQLQSLLDRIFSGRDNATARAVLIANYTDSFCKKVFVTLLFGI